MTKVFISYRRADSEDVTGRLHDFLAGKIGANKVFLDINDIKPGESFDEKIESTLRNCNAILVMIGPDWNPLTSEGTEHRLNDPEDWVRKEVEASLQTSKKVIPILIGGAELPAAETLPDELSPLLRRNAVRLRSGSDFAGDSRKILAAIGQRSRRMFLGAAMALLLSVGIAVFYIVDPFPSKPPTLDEVLMQEMSYPPADVDVENPDLIVNSRIIGEKYGLINDEPWRRKTLVESSGDKRLLFQPRAAAVGGQLHVLYLAKEWDEDILYVHELLPLTGETRIVDQLPWSGGYSFDAEDNMAVKGDYLYYVQESANDGRRHKIGSDDPPANADFYVASKNASYYTSTSPNGRYIVAANSGYGGDTPSADYKLATQGQTGGEFTGISLYDRSTESNSVLFKQDYTGDWSIGTIVWSDDSESLFFDNAGAIACIWKYTLGHRLLQKIVPEHEANSPFFLRPGDREYVIYVDSTTWRADPFESRIMIATE